MHSRWFLGSALLISGCGASDHEGPSFQVHYASGSELFGTDVSKPIALGARSAFGTVVEDIDKATITSNTPSVATIEPTPLCRCSGGVVGTPTQAVPCTGQGVECLDRIGVVTHSPGNADLMVRYPGYEDTPTTIAVREVARSSFVFSSNSGGPAREGDVLELEYGEEGTLELQLFDLAGTKLFAGVGPSWDVADPAPARFITLFSGIVVTGEPVENDLLFVSAQAAGETTLSASFAGIERTLVVRVR